MNYYLAKEYFFAYLKTYATLDTINYYKWSLYSLEEFLIRYRYCDYTLQIDVNKIDSLLLQRYVADKRETIKNVSIRTYMRGIRAFLNYCNDYLECNTKIKIRLPRTDKKLKLPLTSYEVLLLYRAISDNSINQEHYERDTLIIELMLYCGLRLQEIINLKNSDLNIEECILCVNDTKGNKNRIVPIPSSIANKLNSYIWNKHNTNEWVFNAIDCSAKITKSTIENLFRKKLKSVVPRVHPHLLRHTFATSFIMGGGSLEYLRCLLGHTSYNVTQDYISLSTELKLCKYDIFKLDEELFKIYKY